MVSEQKLCLFLNTEVVGRESRARGYEGRRERKLADRRARLGRAEKRRKGKGRAEEVPTDIDTGAGTDPDPDSDSEEEEEREPDHNEPMDTASEDLQLKKVLPALYDKITMMHQDLKQSIKVAIREVVQEVQAGYDARFNAEMRELQATMRELQAIMQDFSSGRRSFTVHANPEVDSGNAPGPSQSTAVSSDPAPSSSARLDPTLEPIRYRFDQKVDTVPDLWTEWSIGLGSGPSIEQLDSTWGAKWKDQNERQFYSRRLPIIKALRQLHASGAATSLQQAATQLETQRGSMTLNKFRKRLKQEAAGATASGSE
jgi:hypothetical protein